MSERPPYIDLNRVTFTELWKLRAQLPGSKSIVSLRHDEETAQKASLELKSSVREMIGDLLTGKDVLELGTGVGRFTQDLATRAKSVISVDITKEMLDRAQCEATNAPNISLLRADGLALPFADESFDVVFEVTLLTHIVDDVNFRQIIDESKRVLRPNGFIFFCGPLSNNSSRMVHPYMILRNPNDYTKVLQPFEITEIRHHRFIDEDYTLMIAR